MTDLAIVSDIHYAGPGEQQRRDFPYTGIANPFRRFLTWQFRHWIWHRDPFAHNHLLDQFIEHAANADVVVANGDYSCDSIGIGLSDPPSRESAGLCLGKLRATFGGRFHAVMGDHEIGKMMMSAERGGLRLASLRSAAEGLEIQPFWRLRMGRMVLLGITSTLAAMPIYEAEALPEERRQWQELHTEHLRVIEEAFAELHPKERVVLFCHDPSALPFLGLRARIRAKLPQLERTVIGHLHTPLVFGLSRYLSGMPEIHFLGHTPRRLSRALRMSRQWAPFKPLLCPSPSGSQLLKDGGFLRARIDETGETPVEFRFHSLKWS